MRSTVYDARWRWDEAAKELRLVVAQKQTGAVFRMPLRVDIEIGNTARRESFTIKPDA